MLLSDLVPGRQGRIKAVRGGRESCARLAALGFAPGTRVQAERPAPGGDPAVFSLRGYTLALRLEEAKRVEVEAE